jgi:aspartyl/glutamyl-tRNA(Asn/Gln) amidotransferase C subunit
MKSKSKIKKENVELVERLSKLKVKETDYYTRQFEETLSVVDEINKLDTKRIAPTNHVTNLKNVYRDDEVDKKRVLSQKEALSGSENTHNGYFLVSAVFENE